MLFKKMLVVKLYSNKGLVSHEIVVLIGAAMIVSIFVAIFYIISSKNLSESMNSAGGKAKEFINTTNNKSVKYIDKLNNIS